MSRRRWLEGWVPELEVEWLMGLLSRLFQTETIYEMLIIKNMLLDSGNPNIA